MSAGLTHRIGYVMPRLRIGLAQSVLATTPAPRREPRQFHGKHPVTRPSAGVEDALILEVRRLYEQARLPPRKIRDALLALGHDKTTAWVSATCNYHNRSHLIPLENASPYLAKDPS